MNKTVFAFDPNSQTYLGPVVLDEGDLSPLDTGVWLIPGNCLEEAPPAIPEGFVAVATAEGQWTLQALPEPEPEPEPEPTAPPAQITMRQARLALLSFGLLDDVQTAINGLTSPQREAAQIEWDYAATVDRDSPMVALMSASMGLDSATLDSLFTAGSTL